MHSNTLGMHVVAAKTLVRGGETFFVLLGHPYLSSYPLLNGKPATIWLPCASLQTRRQMAELALVEPGDLLKMEVVGSMDESGYLEVLETHSVSVKNKNTDIPRR